MADVRRKDRPAGRSWPLALGALVIGVAACAVALTVVGARGALVQVPIALVGLALIFFGVDARLRRSFSDEVNTGAWLAASWLVAVVVAAVFADLLPLSEARDVSQTLTVASRQRPDLWSAHPLGTDSQGLDILGGVIYGARVSLQVGLLAVGVGSVVGGVIGVVAGYFGGRFDAVAGVLTDSLLAFPPLVLLLAIVAAVEPSVPTIALALAALGVPTYVRLARANTLAFANREFVLAARALGATPARIVGRELIPNVVRPLLSYSFIIVAVLIVAEASLSFLGVGIQRPTPTWGNMISAGQTDIQSSPHLVLVPGTVLFITVFALNRLGDAARRLLDPKASAL